MLTFTSFETEREYDFLKICTSVAAAANRALALSDRHGSSPALASQRSAPLDVPHADDAVVSPATLLQTFSGFLKADVRPATPRAAAVDSRRSPMPRQRAYIGNALRRHWRRSDPSGPLSSSSALVRRHSADGPWPRHAFQCNCTCWPQRRGRSHVGVLAWVPRHRATRLARHPHLCRQLERAAWVGSVVPFTASSSERCSRIPGALSAWPQPVESRRGFGVE